MIDLTPLSKYKKECSDYYITGASKRVDIIGFDVWFENQLRMFLDCSNCFNNGKRCIQTNFESYGYEITTTLAMIEKYAENKDYYYEKLLALHNSNLEFEAVNGLEYKIDDSIKKKTTRKRTTQKDIVFKDKPKQETAAERKLKAHIVKINSFSIKIKPVRNDNIV